VRSSSQFLKRQKCLTPIATQYAQHAHELSHMLGLVAIHHGAFAVLERPARACRFSTTALPPSS
jgi:hypothetical protein